MSVAIRAAKDRGHANHGWLDTHHSFSFADYYDPAHMGYRALRVINDDIIRAGEGFPSHGHKDMEIITYIVRGALAHKDTTGGEGIIRRGDVQTMSAGSGVHHSEFNASTNEDVRLLQIWLKPQKEGLTPTYAQAHFSDEQKHNTLCLLVSPKVESGTLAIHQDVYLYASILDAGLSVEHPIRHGRAAWLQVIDGEISLNGGLLSQGDGAAIEGINNIGIKAQKNSEFLLFDLA